MISSYIGKDHTEWSANLPCFQFSINSTFQYSTGYSPYFLNFGREPRFPNDPLLSLEDILPADVPADQYAIELLNRIKLGFQNAQAHIRSAQEHQKEYYDHKRKKVSFPNSAWVWLENHALSNAKRKFSAKLALSG
ncbi:Uncharacterised protein r2_g3759 [Pycnogonum litorale]